MTNSPVGVWRSRSVVNSVLSFLILAPCAIDRKMRLMVHAHRPSRCVSTDPLLTVDSRDRRCSGGTRVLGARGWRIKVRSSIPDFLGKGHGPQSKVLCNRVTNSEASCQAKEQVFVAIVYFWLIQQTFIIILFVVLVGELLNISVRPICALACCARGNCTTYPLTYVTVSTPVSRIISASSRRRIAVTSLAHENDLICV